MATCRDIITRALQMSKILALRSTPTASEAEYGMEAMQALYERWLTNGMFGQLSDLYADVDTTAKERQRIRYPTGVVITFPDLIMDEVDGIDRPPFDLSVVETYAIATQARTVKIWDRNSWVDLLGLTLDSQAPLSGRDRMGLSACVAELIADSFGNDISPSTARMAGSFKFGLSYKIGSTQPARTAEYF